MVYGCDERPWDDESLPWTERVEALRQRMQEWELASGVDRRHVRIVSTEEAERAMAAADSNKEKHSEFILNQVCHDLDILTGMLIGKDNQGGMLREIQSDVRDIKRELGLMDQRHNEEIAKLATRIDQNAKDIDSQHKLRRSLESERLAPLERWVDAQKRGWKAALGWFAKVLGSVAGGLALIYLGARLFGGGG